MMRLPLVQAEVIKKANEMDKVLLAWLLHVSVISWALSLAPRRSELPAIQKLLLFSLQVIRDCDTLKALHTKAKTHSVEHLAFYIDLHGPIHTWWTFRFEAKHQPCKVLALLCNFKNVPASVMHSNVLGLSFQDWLRRPGARQAACGWAVHGARIADPVKVTGMKEVQVADVPSPQPPGGWAATLCGLGQARPGKPCTLTTWQSAVSCGRTVRTDSFVVVVLQTDPPPNAVAPSAELSTSFHMGWISHITTAQPGRAKPHSLKGGCEVALIGVRYIPQPLECCQGTWWCPAPPGAPSDPNWFRDLLRLRQIETKAVCVVWPPNYNVCGVSLVPASLVSVYDRATGRVRVRAVAAHSGELS
jgi:hypothetical protein